MAWSEMWQRGDTVEISQDSFDAYAWVVAKNARDKMLEGGFGVMPSSMSVRVARLGSGKAFVKVVMRVTEGPWDESVYEQMITEIKGALSRLLRSRT